MFSGVIKDITQAHSEQTLPTHNTINFIIIYSLIFLHNKWMEGKNIFHMYRTTSLIPQFTCEYSYEYAKKPMNLSTTFVKYEPERSGHWLKSQMLILIKSRKFQQTMYSHINKYVNTQCFKTLYMLLVVIRTVCSRLAIEWIMYDLLQSWRMGYDFVSAVRVLIQYSGYIHPA